MPGESNYPYRPGSPFKLEETSSKRDKNFRRYASAVDRALSLFDTTLQEWADYISFLGRLLKALQTKPADAHEIPQSKLVAKRLAQCLSPSLPPGVHQKALEVYSTVFSILGKHGLSVELPLYLPGLSPVLSFASLVVRPLLLSLFETYLVDLDIAALRPALKALIMTLLPGLEEPTGEDFERAHNLMNKFRSMLANQSPVEDQSGVPDDRAFWQSFFITCVSSAGKRQGALVYLERNLPNIVADESTATDAPGENKIASIQVPSFIEALTTPEPGLLIRAFAAGLTDEQLLIQRGFLELLVTHLPLNSILFQVKVSALDLELLVSAATSVVLRREMSLNRRLWLWFLGEASSSDQDDCTSPHSRGSSKDGPTSKEAPVLFFQHHALEPLVKGLVKAFDSQSHDVIPRARPFRICLSLMDRWEIGGLVVSRVFKAAMESAHAFESAAESKEAFLEVLRSANVFFDAIQSHLIWKEITDLITQAIYVDAYKDELQQSNSGGQQLDLVWFIVTKFNIREEDMLVIHVPNALTMLLDCAEKILSTLTSSQDQTYWLKFENLIKIAAYLLDQTPEQAFADKVSIEGISDETNSHGVPQKSFDRVSWMMQEWYQGSGEHSTERSTPLTLAALRLFLCSRSQRLVISLIKMRSPKSHLNAALSLARKFATKTIVHSSPDCDELLSTLYIASDHIASEPEQESSFTRALDLISTLEFAKDLLDPRRWCADLNIRHIFARILRVIWLHISSFRPRNNVEATKCLWRLYSANPDPTMVEAAVSSFLYESGKENLGHNITLDGLQRFTSLWTFTVAASQLNRRPSFTPAGTTFPHSSEKSLHSPKVLTRPLLLVLETLAEPKTDLAVFTSNWLQSATSTSLILDILVGRLSTYVLDNNGPLSNDPSFINSPATEPEAISYIIRTITSILTIDSESVNSGFAARSEHKVFLLQESATNGQKTQEGDDSTEGQAFSTIQDQLMNFGLIAMRSQKSGVAEQHDLGHCCANMLQVLIERLDIDLTAIQRAESIFTECLHLSVERADTRLQISLLDLMRLVFAKRQHEDRLNLSKNLGTSGKGYQNDDDLKDKQLDAFDKNGPSTTSAAPKNNLLDCVIFALTSSASQPALTNWVQFLDFVLPYYASSLFQILLPLTDAIRTAIESTFEQLRKTFEQPFQTSGFAGEPIQAINALYNAFELVLARSHDHITHQEAKKLRLPEPSHGYFGNMVSGFFPGETQHMKPVTANDRLTVLLCFRDAVRISFRIWAWENTSRARLPQDVAISTTFTYTSVRLRNRTLKALENLFAAEPLECLEVLNEIWKGGGSSTVGVLKMLKTLGATRPKHAMPAIFNALYSRTSPASLDAFRTSTLTADLSEVELAAFLVAYTRSMDDDALDEVWTDCMTFAKDILANPMPQRQILPLLIEFIAILGDKIHNTNFGEQRRMAKDIGDLFVRLLAATFTIKPISFPQDDADTVGSRAALIGTEAGANESLAATTDVVTILSSVLPGMVKTLIDADRISTAASTISTQIMGPAFHWKAFPHNINSSFLSILHTMSRVTETSKLWKRDVMEAFNEPKFFSTRSLFLIRDGWMPLLRHLTLVDKDRMAEMLSRLTAPTSAGIMFGVGASSARLEADRKTQVTLRRIAFLILAADDDAFVPNMKLMQDKTVELLGATAASSPSSNTRAELYMVFRALALKNAPVHLTSFWPIINAELREVLASMAQIASREVYNITSILQAAKLLDTLLILGIDDFQVCEWLYITDTVEAVYRPPKWRPVALIDELLDILDHQNDPTTGGATPLTSGVSDKGTKPLLRWDHTHQVPREQLLDHVLTPFMRNLSINAFESTYRMEKPDTKACLEELLKDLFDDTTLV